MNLLGGAGTLLGSVLGPTVLTLFAELTRPIHGSIAAIVFGLMLIVSLIYLPEGVTGGLKRISKCFIRKKTEPEENISSQRLEPEEVVI